MSVQGNEPTRTDEEGRKKKRRSYTSNAFAAKSSTNFLAAAA